LFARGRESSAQRTSVTFRRPASSIPQTDHSLANIGFDPLIRHRNNIIRHRNNIARRCGGGKQFMSIWILSGPWPGNGARCTNASTSLGPWLQLG